MPAKQIVAQMFEDLYYQQYKTNSDFFDIHDFIFWTGAGYAAILQAEYEKSYALLRADRQDDIVFFSQEWVQSQIIELKKDDEKNYIGELKFPVMGFKYDQQNVGIQNVFPVGESDCGELVRTTINKVWHFNYLPNCKKRFWYQDGNAIKFLNLSTCKLSKGVRISYIPASDNELLLIPDGWQMDVINMGLKLMLEAKNGKIIPRINNLDGNKVIQTEADLQPIK